MEIGTRDHLVALTNATVVLLEFASATLRANQAAIGDDGGRRVRLIELQSRIDTALEQLRSVTR